MMHRSVPGILTTYSFVCPPGEDNLADDFIQTRAHNFISLQTPGTRHDAWGHIKKKYTSEVGVDNDPTTIDEAF